MHGTALHESLARRRRHYERMVYGRLHEALTWEDAEDIVSDALLRVQAAAEKEPPQRGKEDAWFRQVLFHQAMDFLRSRDGRKRENSDPRPVVVSLSDMSANGREPADGDGLTTIVVEELDEAREREQASETIRRVMRRLNARDAELVKIRHLAGHEGATRAEVAAMVGMTLGEFRTAYERAWSRFVDAVARDTPTDRCQQIRQLLGEVEAGTAPSEAVHEIDVHTLGCASCRVFARESYRALELIPWVPVVGFTERWSTRINWWWERSNPEVTAGAGGAAAGAGLAGLLGGGGAAGALKIVAAVCGATAVTAGVCAGIVAVVDDLSKPEPATAVRAEKPKRTPTPTPTAVATPAVAKATTKRSTRPRTRQTSADLSGERQIPATAPEGSSEFNPSASSARRDPAPAPVAGGGEFAP